MTGRKYSIAEALLAGFTILLLAACAGGADSTTGTNIGGGGSSVARLELSTASVRLGAIGASAQVQATARNSSGTVLNGVSVKWTSDDITVADVAGSGTTAVITARAPGQTVVRASTEGITLEIGVRVLSVRALTITPATGSLRSGSQLKLSAVLDADQGIEPEIRWASDNPAVVTISAQGVATGVGEGTAVIRATAAADSRVSATATLTVTSAKSVRILNAPSFMRVGDNASLGAFSDLDPNQSSAVTWSSSQPSVASISATGVLTALSPGNTIIRLTSAAEPALQDSIRIEVRAAQSVVITPSRFTLGAGANRQLAVQVTMDAGVSTAVTWKSDNPAIALVAQNGTVTGVSRGTATITATSVADTSRKGTAIVDVAPAVRDIELEPAALSMSPGDVRQLTVSLSADEGASRIVLWRTSNAAVASIGQDGAVTAVANGSAIITAMAEADTTRRATALITVRNAPRVTATPQTVSMLPGKTQTLSATVTADPGVSTAVTWRSGNPSIAAVNSSGLLTAISPGITTINAVSVADTTRKASVTVTVNSPIQSISVSPASATIGRGLNVQLKPSVVTQEQQVSTAVSYRSSNPSVASVNYAGLVTGIGIGKATITVLSAADTLKKATAEVTVSSQPPQLAKSWTASRMSGALYEDIVSLDAVDASIIFAVNSVGDIYRYDGTRWILSARGQDFGTRFSSVSASGPDNAMAVGSGGVIARLSNSSWTKMSSPTNNDLADVYYEGSATGYAVGSNGTILVLNGSTWAKSSSGTTVDLGGVWAGGGAPYVVGASGTILRFNGTSWVSQFSGTSETLRSISGRSTNDIIAVGTFGAIIRYDGIRWATVMNTRYSSEAYSVVADKKSSSRYFIATDDGIIELNGFSVSSLVTPYTPRMFAVAQNSNGNLLVGGQRGIVMRYQSSQWETLNAAPDLIDVWTTSTTNAWAVGEFGFVYRWNGSAWSRESTPTTATLNTVWGLSEGNAFAAGDEGTMLHWNGTSWTAMSLPTSAAIYGLWGSAADNVYAVSSAGQILRYNGTAWSIASSTSSALWSVYGTSSSNVWASGADGRVLRFDGSAWTATNTPTAGTIASVFALDSNNVWAVGADVSGMSGLAYSRTGNNWTNINVGSGKVLTSIWGPTEYDIYAVGDNGTIQRFNGSTWSSMNSGTTELLWAVSGSPNGSGVGGAFAVGYNGSLVSGSSNSAVIGAMQRVATPGGYSLNPAPGAKRTTQPLPTGNARATRKHRAMITSGSRR